MTEYCRDILHVLLPSRPTAPKIPWSYPTGRFTNGMHNSIPESYVAVHPGSGSPFKDWGEGNWQSLVLSLRAAKFNVVITGSGPQETEFADRLSSLTNGIVSVSGRTTWEDFVCVISSASAVICPDSAAAHVAAFFRVPTVAIFTGTNNPHQWAPQNSNARVLFRDVPCAPCHRPGCRAMACIRGVSVNEVLDALTKIDDARLNRSE